MGCRPVRHRGAVVCVTALVSTFRASAQPTVSISPPGIWLSAPTPQCGPNALPCATVGTPFVPPSPYSNYEFVATGGAGGYTWAPGAISPPTGLNLTPGGLLTGTPLGCATYPTSFCSAADTTEPIITTFTVTATDSLGASSAPMSYSIGVYWNPTEASFLATTAANNAGMVAATPAAPPPIIVGAHLTPANPAYEQSATNSSTSWNTWIDAMYAAGIRRVNIEPDLDCIYQQGYMGNACLTWYAAALSHARSLGMSISINPEYSGGITTDCTTILMGTAINSGGGAGGPGYAPGVGDWYTCLTTGLSAVAAPGNLGGLSLYQWIVVNWLQDGDTFVVLHEPTTMTSRWLEGTSGVCNNHMPTGNTCPADWLNNFLYGSSNNIINHVINCAAGATMACAGTSININVGVTTMRGEIQNPTPGYTSVFASSIPSTITVGSTVYPIPMGLDIYAFASTDLQAWITGIGEITGGGHTMFVEEFAMQRWVQNETPPLADNEANSIKGAMSCDWEPTISYNLENTFAAFLPWISSQGAVSASLFDTAVLAACVSTGISNIAYKPVLRDADMSFANAIYSDASYRLASLIRNWSQSAWSPPSLVPGVMTITGAAAIQ